MSGSGPGISSLSTPSRTLKRQRSYSSPETSPVGNMESSKVGDLTQGQLMSCLSQLLDSKLDSKLANLATKEDIHNLTARVTALTADNAALQHEVSLLRQQNSRFASKLLDLEARSRRNNLIFRGLKVGEKTTDYREAVSRFCSEVLGNERIWINRAHPLGKDRTTVIAHIPQDTDIDYIMSRVKTLKGTGFVVHRDYPQEVREKRARLHEVRCEVERVTGRRRMPLVFDHLTVEGCKFTWQDGKLRAGQQDGGTKLNSLLGKDFTEFLSKQQTRVSREEPETIHPATGNHTGSAEGSNTKTKV